MSSFPEVLNMSYQPYQISFDAHTITFCLCKTAKTECIFSYVALFMKGFTQLFSEGRGDCESVIQYHGIMTTM